MNRNDGRVYIATIDENGKLCYSEITDSIPELINADNEILKGIIEGMRIMVESLIPSILDKANRNINLGHEGDKKFLEYFN